MKRTAQEQTTKSLNREQSPSLWMLVGIPACLVATTIASYYASLAYNFQFDDIANIKKMFDIRHNTLAKLFFARPRWISQWLNTVYYGYVKFDPYLYRVGNLIIHSIGGILVFYLIYTLFSGLRAQNFFKRNSLAIAATTAGLFLLHPVQTQTVSYVIQGQLEGMAGVFTIAIVLFFVKWVQATTPRGRWGFGTLLIVTSLLSIGTKEITIVAPLMVLLTDWFFVAQGNWSEIKGRWQKHAAVWAAIILTYVYFKAGFMLKAATFQLESRNNIGNQLTQDPAQKIYPLHFAISQFKVIVHYLVMFVWPFNISVEYDWMLSTSFFAADCFLPFLSLVALWSYLGYLFSKNKTNILVFAFAWFFIAVLPRSSIIPSSELLVDYKTYLASVGVLLLIASALVWVITAMGEQARKRMALAAITPITSGALACMLALVGYGAHERNKVWRSGLEFWGNIIANAPGKARAYNNYAVALSDLKRYAEAVPFYKKAVQMDGKYPDPLNNLAVVYSILGDTDAAIVAMRKTIEIQPYYPEAYNNLASFYIQKKEYDKAEKMLKIALKLRKHYGKAYFNYGKLYLQQEKFDEALPYFKKACMEADMDIEPGFKVYAQVAFKAQKWDEAVIAVSKLCELNPSSVEYNGQLGQALLMDKQYAKSLSVFERLVQVKPEEPKYWFNAGEAAYQLEEYQKGRDYFSKAQSLGYKTPNVYVRLASCYSELDQRKEAREALLIAQGLPDVSTDLKAQIKAQMTKL